MAILCHGLDSLMDDSLHQNVFPLFKYCVFIENSLIGLINLLTLIKFPMLKYTKDIHFPGFIRRNKKKNDEQDFI